MLTAANPGPSRSEEFVSWPERRQDYNSLRAMIGARQPQRAPKLALEARHAFFSLQSNLFGCLSGLKAKVTGLSSL